MLGSEYHWLITPSRSNRGTPRARVFSPGLFTLAVAVFCFFCLAVSAEPPHRTLLREAAGAAQAGDNDRFIAKLEAARALRPDYPRVRFDLARGYGLAGRADEALAELRELADMGLVFDLAHDRKLAALHDRPGFAALLDAFAVNRSPVGRGGPTSSLTDVDGIIEGLACHPATHQWYFSDVHNRCLWQQDVASGSGRLKQFSSDSDHLLGVFGLRIDEARNTLWAGTAALPEMKGYTAADQGRAALVEFDLASGRVRRSFPVPPDGRDHVLGDVLLAPDGSIFTSDSTAPIIWRLAPGAAKLEKWRESADFVSLQGMAFSADGKHLLVADYANGLWRIELATRAMSLLTAPAHTTLFGLDGIYSVPDGLVAVQNGVNPQRILHLALTDDGRVENARVLLSGQAAMTDLALGQVIAGRFHCIGNSGWSLYEDPKATPAARTVTVLSLSVK